MSLQLVVQNAAYTLGDVIGGKLEFPIVARTPGNSGFIASVSMNAKAACSKAFRLIFFKSDPSATAFTENSALALHADDYLKPLAHIDILAADWADLGTPDLMTQRNINQPIDLPDGITSLFAVLIMRDAVDYTPGTTSDLMINLGLSQD